MAQRPGAILIAGPTASGKSALAIDVARACNGVIINTDSMQVYDALRFITARPTPDGQAGVPHRLYGSVPAATRFSVGRWLEAAARELEAARAAGTLPIFVGGTGLYFKALTQGLAPIPPVPEDALQNWRAEAERVGSDMLHAILAGRDAETAGQLDPADTQRIVRALGVLDATGRSLADWQSAETAPPLLALEDCRCVFLDPERGDLHQRINARFDSMMADGALEEVRALLALELDASLPVMRAHGVPHLIAHLEGRSDLVTAVARAKGDTRRYAKRQKTWFRHQMPGWPHLPVEDASALLLRSLLFRR